jgi:hypothetical protein
LDKHFVGHSRKLKECPRKRKRKGTGNERMDCEKAIQVLLEIAFALPLIAKGEITGNEI